MSRGPETLDGTIDLMQHFISKVPDWIAFESYMNCFWYEQVYLSTGYVSHKYHITTILSNCNLNQ